MIGQVECSTTLSDEMRVRDRPRVHREQLRHHIRRPEKELAVGPSQAMRALQRRAVLDRYHRVLQAVATAHVVVNVARRHQ